MKLRYAKLLTEAGEGPMDIARTRAALTSRFKSA